MFKKLLLISSVFALAFVILSISILQTSRVSRVFTSNPITALTPDYSVLGTEDSTIDYIFPYAGSVLPDNPLWVLKATRDRVWYLITGSPLRKAELALLFADKRLLAAQDLLEEKKMELAVSTISKGEKYLEIAAAQEEVARKDGYDTSEFLAKLAIASLKHREVLEKITPFFPEEGRPYVIKSEDYSKNAFNSARDALNSKGLPVPKSPFVGD